MDDTVVQLTSDMSDVRWQGWQDHEYLTASNLNSFFHFGCQLELWKSFHEGHVPRRYESPSSISRAHISRGHQWEKSLIRCLDAENLILRMSKRTTFEAQVVADPRNHFYVINSEFKERNLFVNEYLSRRTTPVAFGTFKPDFIEVWKRVELGRLVIDYHVIDAKASYALHIAHQAQVYFYWRALQELLPSDTFVPTSTASIWLLNEDKPTPFSPEILKPQMDSFLFSTLPRVVRLPHDQVPWHYNTTCNTCMWNSTCRQRTEQEQTVSLIPDLSIEEASFLQEVIKLNRKGVTTDIEELDLLVSGGLQEVQQKYPTTASRFRTLMGMKRGEIGRSAVLEAAKTKLPQFLRKPTFHFPRAEEYAVVISLVIDPSSLSSHPFMVAFDITVFYNGQLQRGISAHGTTNIVPSLAHVITSIPPRSTAQVYCWSPEEVVAINRIIVQESLSEESEEVRICIAAMVDVPLALLTPIQPELLENSLYRSWTKASKLELEQHLSQLGLGTDGNVKVLQDRLRDAMTSDNPSLRRLPKIVSLHHAISELVALPGPGYTTLVECAKHILGPCSVPTDEEMYNLASRDELDTLWLKLRARGMTIFRIIQNLRSRLREYSGGDISNLLINEAHPISLIYVQLCQDSNLRKLIFMHEYETLLSLKELWLERVDSTRSAPIVEFTGFAQDGSWNAHFTILEGSRDIDVGGDMKLFEWILSRVGTDGAPEILFDDLSFFNLVFPVRRDKWSAQPDSVLENLAVAHPVSLDLSTVTLQLYRSSSFTIAPGQKFRLLRRLVDFNTSKILRNFLEIDVSSRMEKNFFLRLLEDPNQVGQGALPNRYENAREESRLHGLYRELRDLGNSDAVQLVFQRSQRRVMQSILKRQVTIAWGPPGTGKTHTLALSVLYLLEILYLNSNDRVVVWMTAVTNAAIEMFVKKFEFLRDRIRAIPNLDKRWLDALSIVRLTAGTKPDIPPTRLTLMAGTVWQLWNWNEKKKQTANVVIIDEGGQMNVGTAALAIRWLDVHGRLLVAGDHLQLAPILKGVYPKSDCALFGSILHCLLRNTSMFSPDAPPSSPVSEIFYQLEENFRLNPHLCNFVELIYSKRFQPMQSRREIAKWGQQITQYLESSAPSMTNLFMRGMAEVMQSAQSQVMRPPISRTGMASTLFLMKLVPRLDHFSPAESHLRLESLVVAHLVRDLAFAFMEETIFVVTPHRVQRSLVAKELASFGLSLRSREHPPMSRIWVDTTERMQGSEADIVVCLFSHTHVPSLRRDLDFLYNRPRLNVAISRAKTISIVISSEGVLNPPVEALVDRGNLDGFTYLKAYEDRAWRYNYVLEPRRSPDSSQNRPNFSSQEFKDEEWEECVAEELEAQFKSTQISNPKSSQGSSQYDDPELLSLMQHFSL